jgi:hypothetical protein
MRLKTLGFSVDRFLRDVRDLPPQEQLAPADVGRLQPNDVAKFREGLRWLEPYLERLQAGEKSSIA